MCIFELWKLKLSSVNEAPSYSKLTRRNFFFSSQSRGWRWPCWTARPRPRSPSVLKRFALDALQESPTSLHPTASLQMLPHPLPILRVCFLCVLICCTRGWRWRERASSSFISLVSFFYRRNTNSTHTLRNLIEQRHAKALSIVRNDICVITST